MRTKIAPLSHPGLVLLRQEMAVHTGAKAESGGIEHRVPELRKIRGARDLPAQHLPTHTHTR